MSQTLVIVGAQGDLTSRLLLPGLGGLIAGPPERDIALVGSGRGTWTDERWRSVVVDAFAAGNARGPAVDAVAATARYISADATDEDDLRKLLAACDGRVTLYFALPPAVTIEACRALARIGVPDDTRLVLEKPFGVDMASTIALNDLLHTLVPEDHVHRVEAVIAGRDGSLYPRLVADGIPVHVLDLDILSSRNAIAAAN